MEENNIKTKTTTTTHVDVSYQIQKLGEFGWGCVAPKYYNLKTENEANKWLVKLKKRDMQEKKDNKYRVIYTEEKTVYTTTKKLVYNEV